MLVDELCELVDRNADLCEGLVNHCNFEVAEAQRIVSEALRFLNLDFSERKDPESLIYLASQLLYPDWRRLAEKRAQVLNMGVSESTVHTALSLLIEGMEKSASYGSVYWWLFSQ
jgi:hypothetical protein